MSLSHHSVTTMWHDDSLTCDNFLIFFKNSKKFKKIIKIQKKNNKTIQKIEELTCCTPSNGVNLGITEKANLRRFNKKWTNLRLLKIWVPFWDFDSKMGNKSIIKPCFNYLSMLTICDHAYYVCLNGIQMYVLLWNETCMSHVICSFIW